MPGEEIVKLLDLPGLAVFLRRLDRRLLEIAGSPYFSGPVSLMIKSGGKRLRPTILFAAASLTSKTQVDRILPLAAAIELTHLASIVHDDVIDQGTERRGQPSAVNQLGARDAVLLGDYLLARAFAEANGFSGAAARLSDAVSSMAEGVALESDGQHHPSVDESYIKSVRLKTGALFGLAGRLGGQLGGLSENQSDRLERYGDCFGVSFQIIDDCLDGHFPGPFRAESEAAAAYCRRAVQELDSLTPGPALAALRRLPDAYLRSTLSQ